MHLPSTARMLQEGEHQRQTNKTAAEGLSPNILGRAIGGQPSEASRIQQRP
jgi:hypothetical protein